jgi:hypothetical protein
MKLCELAVEQRRRRAVREQNAALPWPMLEIQNRPSSGIIFQLKEDDVCVPELIIDGITRVRGNDILKLRDFLNINFGTGV